MGQIKGHSFTVAGVPWDELTEDYKRKVIKRNTDVVADIVTREVVKMAEAGRSVEDIRKFLGLDLKEEVPC